MIKKIGALGLLIGGLLAAIGGIGSIANAASLTDTTSFRGMASAVDAAINMAVLARVGAIIAFVAAIVAVAGVVKDNMKKGGAITSMVFAVVAFIGQFMINPITSWKNAASAGMSGNAEAQGVGASIGLILLILSGIVLLILGVVGLVSKNKSTTFNG